MLKKCILLFKWTIFLYILMGFMVQFFNTLGIKIFQQLLDKVVLAKSFNEVTSLVILYGALLVGSTVLNYLMEYPHIKLSNNILEKLRIMALSKVSKIDYSSYQNRGTGEVIKIIDNGALAGKNIIHAFYLRIFYELVPTIVFSLYFLSLYNMKIMMAIAAGYVVIFFLNNILLRTLYRIKSSLLEKQEKMSKYSIRGFIELVVFRLNKRYDKEIERLQHTADDIVNKNTQLRMIHESFFALFALLVNIIKVIVLVFGIQNVMSGETSIGIIIALIMFIDQVYTPLAIFNVLYVDYKLNRVTYHRFEEFLNAPEDRNLDRGRDVKTIQGDIEFKNVNFDYETSSILNDVTFSVSQGSSIAIIGLSGSGKSTIVKLMLGLLKKNQETF